MARKMKAETLWKKAKQWCATRGIPYTYAGAQGIAPFWGYYVSRWFSVLGITSHQTPDMVLNDKGEWIILY
jgi:hypothetical protein